MLTQTYFNHHSYQTVRKYYIECAYSGYCEKGIHAQLQRKILSVSKLINMSQGAFSCIYCLRT